MQFHVDATSFRENLAAYITSDEDVQKLWENDPAKVSQARLDVAPSPSVLAPADLMEELCYGTTALDTSDCQMVGLLGYTLLASCSCHARYTCRLA